MNICCQYWPIPLTLTSDSSLAAITPTMSADQKKIQCKNKKSTTSHSQCRSNSVVSCIENILLDGMSKISYTNSNFISLLAFTPVNGVVTRRQHVPRRRSNNINQCRALGGRLRKSVNRTEMDVFPWKPITRSIPSYLIKSRLILEVARLSPGQYNTPALMLPAPVPH